MTLTINDYDKIVHSHQKTPPVQIVPIANDMGLKVYKVSSWKDTLSGMILKNKETGGKSGYAIFVNASHAETRRRFTIAHEIAHYVLHKNLIGDGIKDDVLYRSGLGSVVETQANRYAADMLMPWNLLNNLLREGKENTEELAKIFNVSQSAMSIRLGVPC